MKKQYFWKNEKVSLRIIEEKDAKTLYEALKDTTLRMQAEGGIALPATVEKAEDMALYAMEMTQEGKELWFAILDNENRMVGYAILGYINERDGNAQCDVTILPAYRKKGYGKNTYDILLKYAFYERRLHKINCFVMEGNEHGIAFLKAVGFTMEAARSAMFYSHGKYYAQYYFGITKEEFDKQAKSTEDAVKDSCLGQLKKPLKPFPSLLKDRPYFWQYDNVIVRDMTEEDYYKNREILFSSWDARFYDNDVKLPMLTEGLTEKEEEHLHFGNLEDRIEFAVTDLDGEYAGNINLHSIDRKNGTFSISLYFLERARKKGYAVNAMALIMSYAFNELRLNKMNICVNDGNEASARVMRRVGCQVEGIWRDNVYYNGEYIDVVLFGITKAEFEKIIN